MTPERYNQVKNLFHLLLEQPPAQRPAYLERACGADGELYQQVRQLLESDSTSETFLEVPAVTPLSKILADAASEIQEPLPTTIGPYAVQKLLGSGGMGAVYLAVRADQSYTKQVAIKVIHRGLESDKVLQRFRQERQIIASLDHPNIARLLDGGATDDGRPYIVMEHVDGIPINRWCDHHRLRTNKRLAIFLQVCDAVQYAHQNLIIHRDLKPGNILVRSDSTVKLLDFGIAKLINSATSTPAADKTATSMRLMTPQYASPEQLKGDAVTTATDVYLLGIVLYELLTGHRPYDVKEQNALDAIRAYTHGEPQKPSQAIFRSAPHSVHISAVREGTPSALRGKLQGDLDAILLRALRRHPAERYQSTAQFAQDIRSHLLHLPVTAIPDTPAYRARLFLRRNTALAISTAAAVSLLLLLTVFAFWQAASARNERLRAEARFSDVRKMSKVLLYDVQDALAPLSGATQARRILLDRALDYLSALSRESNADPTLRLELATAYIRVGHLQGNPNFPNLGNTAGASTSYRRAQTILEQLHQQDPNNAQITNDLATAQEALADMLALNGHSATTLQSLRRAADLRTAANSAPELKTVTFHNLAIALAASGANDEALALSRKAHQIALSLSGPNAPRLHANSHSHLAAVLRSSGDNPHAAESYRIALKLYEELAAATPLAAGPKRELSFALQDLAEIEPPQAAAALLQRSLQLRQDLAAADPQNLQALRDLALAWQSLGSAQLQAGHSPDALNSFRQLLQTARDWTRHDPANPYANQMLAAAHIKMAEALPSSGDPDGAISSARAAIRILDALLEKDKDNQLFRRERSRAQSLLETRTSTQ